MAVSKVQEEKAGVVVYNFVQGDEPHILLITSRKHRGSWVFPVGTVERGESLELAAKRECAEEAGYYVDIGEKLPTLRISDDKTTIEFTFFLATVVANATRQEMDRRIDWLPMSKVANLVPSVFRPVAIEAIQRLMQMDSA